MTVVEVRRDGENSDVGASAYKFRVNLETGREGRQYRFRVGMTVVAAEETANTVT
jgi:hypothetical protein